MKRLLLAGLLALALVGTARAVVVKVVDIAPDLGKPAYIVGSNESLVLENTTFRGASSGVIQTWPGARVRLINCRFEDCRSQSADLGGVLDMRGGIVYAEGCSVSGCGTVGSGGFANIRSGHLFFVASTVAGCSAEDFGGAICARGAYATYLVANSTFVDNLAGSGGGAIYSEGVKKTYSSVFSSLFALNFAGSAANDVDVSGISGCYDYVGGNVFVGGRTGPVNVVVSDASGSAAGLSAVFGTSDPQPLVVEEKGVTHELYQVDSSYSNQGQVPYVRFGSMSSEVLVPRYAYYSAGRVGSETILYGVPYSEWVSQRTDEAGVLIWERSTSLTGSVSYPIYAIRFIRNDGSGRTSCRAYPSGISHEIPSLYQGLGWGRRGFHFKGWATTPAKARAGEIWKENYATVRQATRTGQVLNIYASWTLDSSFYEIRFNKNDGSGAWRSVAYKYGEKTRLATCRNGLQWDVPGRTFKGWSLTPGGPLWKGDWAYVSTPVPAGKTLNVYALWE